MRLEKQSKMQPRHRAASKEQHTCIQRGVRMNRQDQDRVLSGISGRSCSGSTHAQSLGTVEHVYEHELLPVVPIV